MLLTTFGFPMETVLVFIALTLGAMAVDLWAHRNNHIITLKSAAMWSAFWVLISLTFGAYLGWRHGGEAASLFFTGYALEKVLSVDNLFVMMAIFSWFNIPENLRHRVLYWGIAGAIVFRLIFVALGTSLLSLSPYMEFGFAIAVAASGYFMMQNQDNDDDEAQENYHDHIAYRLVHRFFPVFPKLHGEHFFLRGKTLAAARAASPDVHLQLAGENVHDRKRSRPKKLKPNAWVATPLFLCLAVIELTDVMFAFDSVPAVIAVSREPLIVYSAMIFAILGLRTLYFLLDNLRSYLIYLEAAVCILLYFIAFKLLLSASNHVFEHGWQISPNASLVVVILVLTTGVVASLVFPENQWDTED